MRTKNLLADTSLDHRATSSQQHGGWYRGAGTERAKVMGELNAKRRKMKRISPTAKAKLLEEIISRADSRRVNLKFAKTGARINSGLDGAALKKRRP
jgi:ribosomal protein L18